MDGATWLGLEPTDDPLRWRLPITPGISTLQPALFGGCGLGAVLAAMEGSTGRPAVWATAQYLSYARPPEVMDIDVTLAVSSHNITQARAVGHVAGREVLTVNAALGRRSFEPEGQWAERPQVVAPDLARPAAHRFPGRESIMTRLDIRLADARGLDEIEGNPMPAGRSSLWVRMPDGLDASAAALAVLGDYVPFGIGQAIGAVAGGNSLDNTLRVVRPVPTEWVLLDVRIDGIANGFGHGTVHLWSDDGTLMATAGQSTIARYWRA
ncbi:MAG: acyl-CoA thioesterase [Acidimicrobiia bacterium]